MKASKAREILDNAATETDRWIDSSTFNLPDNLRDVSHNINQIDLEDSETCEAITFIKDSTRRLHSRSMSIHRILDSMQKALVRILVANGFAELARQADDNMRTGWRGNIYAAVNP
jgi:hypothetical protein